MTTGLVYHPVFLQHDTGAMHPECPERLRAILDGLDRSGLRSGLMPLAPQAVERAWLALVHSPEHLDRISAAASRAEGGTVYLDPDTPLSAASGEAALKAAGGVLTACDQVLAGPVDNAFCLVRPPGHHAEPNRAMGFCLYNNVSIAARYLQRRHGLKRILIVDWDVHHGNGTQAAFWRDPTVLYYSIHQYPHYPGSGAGDEVGEGPGEGTIINSPMSAGGGDVDYLDCLERVLMPAAERFLPEFILISAGFDAHRDDPLANMRVTADGFGRMTALVMDLADRLCAGRLVSVLEGGYNLDALARSVNTHISVLKGAG